jgi:hypothetical protein
MTERHDNAPTPRPWVRELNARLTYLIDTVRRIRRVLTELTYLLMTVAGLVALVLGWLR